MFVGTDADQDLETVILPDLGFAKGKMWHRTKEAIRYAHEKHSEDFDWILLAEDDTYSRN